MRFDSITVKDKTGAAIELRSAIENDAEDLLKYLKVTIGCAMDENGDPYRYSNINVYDFSITRT